MCGISSKNICSSIMPPFHKVNNQNKVLKLKKGKSIETMENEWFSVTIQRQCGNS